MSAVVVFTVVFLPLFVITLVFPSLPPGELLYNLFHSLFGIPETTFTILGFSGKVIVNGIVNGFIWAGSISMIYSLGRRTSTKREVVEKVEKEVIVVPVSVPTPNPMPTPAPVMKRPVARPKVRTYVSLDQDIETIEGIGPRYGSRFRVIGVNLVGDLLRAGSTWKRRRDLAEKVGVSPSIILKWVNQADFFRIRGIGKQYADLLDAAGVNTVKDLSRRNPRNLYLKLRDTNLERNLVRRVPPYRVIEGWIRNAKRLRRIVEY